MKTEVKVKDVFVHGRTRYEPGAEKNPTFSKQEATELERNGLVEIVGDAVDDAEDLLGDGKMAPAAANKMAAAPENKMAKSTTKK